MAAAPVHARPAPARAPQRREHVDPRRGERRADPRPDLRVVGPRRRLRTGPTVVLGGLLAFAIALGLVVAQALLVQGQQRLDQLESRRAEAERLEQELRLQIAELESPERVVAAATALGMVPPDTVTYLTSEGEGG